jgi:hypothetical protein
VKNFFEHGEALTILTVGDGFEERAHELLPARNSVSAFSVAANGALTEVPGSPFLTGGSGVGGGGSFAINRITTARDFLYAVNIGSNNVSGYSVNPATGVLATVPGSPFATGAAVFSLAATPDDNFLIATSWQVGQTIGGSNTTVSNTITVYSIAVNGALSQVPGSPFPAGDIEIGGQDSGTKAIKVTPDGKFLAVVRNGIPGVVSMFTISATGGLTACLGHHSWPIQCPFHRLERQPGLTATAAAITSSSARPTTLP